MNATVIRIIGFALVWMAGMTTGVASDWPMYRHDAQRSAATAEQLALPLKLAWSYPCAQPPAPAWPDSFRLVNRMDFDYAPALVIADGLMCFGSSADDTVRALDAATGKEKWHFITGGPVRFAPAFASSTTLGATAGKPQIEKGKVYFASDDGFVYCLDAATGKLVWKFNAAPADERFVGNHRMISRWPIRTGVLVDGGVVYAVAGMWTMEGVFIYALAADTGKIIWCNDTLGGTPQGALLLGGDVLLIPNGNNKTTPLDRHTGALMQWPSPPGASGCGPGWLAGQYAQFEADPRTGKPARKEYLGGGSGRGGTWVTLDGDNEYAFAIHRGGVLGIEPYFLTNGLAGEAWGAGAVPQLSIESSWGPNQIHERGKVSAIVHEGKLYARKAYGLALAGDTLLLGHDGAVVAESAAPIMAELRFGLAGDALALFAVVPDRNIVPAAQPWKGSCVEVFASLPGQSRIGQVFLIPASKSAPAVAHRAHDGRFDPAPEIGLRSAATETGYELSALIPLSLLELDKTGNYRLEAQVTVTGPDGTLQRDTLFGSTLAYQDNRKYGTFRLKPLEATPALDQVEKALAAEISYAIKMRGASELWRAAVDGEARDLAVAAGRLFVSTSEGAIYAFAPGGGRDAASSPRALRDAESGDGKADGRNQNPEQSEISNLKSEIGDHSPSSIPHQPSSIPHQPLPINHQPLPINHSPSTISISHLHSSGMDRGFALVLGDADGRMSMELAAQTQLRVIVALSDESAVSALRERLLATTAWYGSRIHIQHVERLDALPFPQYFANAVIVAADVAGRDKARPSTNGIVTGGPRSVVAGLSGKELYRVLRPCGGILLFPGLKATEAEALVKETGASESEIRAPPSPNTYHRTPITEHLSPNTAPAIVRGKLPDSLDWDQEPGGIFRVRRGADQRVKWPLRLLWFGGPSTRQAQNDVEGANSRPGPAPANGRYFMFSERALTAVDAYNGAVLWSHFIPEASPGTRDVDGVLYRVSERPSAQGRPDRSRGLRVNNESVFLVLGAEYFQGKGEGTIQLDARTGEQQKIYGRFNPPTLVPLKTSLTWLLKNVASASDNKPPDAAALKLPGLDDQDDSDPLFQAAMQDVGHALGEIAIAEKRALAGMEVNDGCLTLSQDSSRLRVKLATRDASVTPLDAYDLYFDFRPVEARYGLYEHGAFHIRVVSAQDEKTPASWRLIGGADHPKLDVSGARNEQGTETTVVFSRTEIEKWLGEKLASFDFAATLNAYNGGPASNASHSDAGGRDEPLVRRHLFGNWAADGINNGWARIVLDEAAAAAVGTNPPAIMGSGAPGGSYGPAGYEQRADPLALAAPGIHPLTGEPVPKIYGISAVCGAAYSSANIISQGGGLYDLTENGGRHLCYPGVKTACTTPQLAALGLLIISEEWGHCVCNYSFRDSSLALAPAERRLNEDWASFYERDVDTRVRQAFVNLGAPGDRRDDKGNLWLRFPRNSNLQSPDDFLAYGLHSLPYPLGMRDTQTGLWYRRSIRPSLAVPLEVECAVAAPLPVEAEAASSFGPYRFNADRVRIQGTDRPWIYGSGYRGIRKATLQLNFFKPLISLPTSAAIAIDGKLDEATWIDAFRSTNGIAPLLPYIGARVVFRHDSQNLYMGIQQPPMIFRATFSTAAPGSSKLEFKSEPRPWRATTNSAPDAISDRDTWWRLIVSDASARKAVYLTVTPNGTRADALHDLATGRAGPSGVGTSATTNALNRAWNGSWQSAVVAGTNGMTLEMTIPWAMLAEAGLNKDQLAVNFLMCDLGIGTEALTHLGIGGYDRCSNFTPLGFGKPASVPARAFTVRLHFAEPDEEVKAGQRVFDVLLQGQPVLTGFDIVKEAGGARTAVVKEFPHVSAAESLTVEFKPRAAVPDSATAPVLNGLEVVDESWSAAASPE